MTSQETVAKYLTKVEVLFLARDIWWSEKPMGEGLGSFGFSLDVRIGNDAPTFHTVHLAGLVFLLRDGIGDQAAVRTGVRRVFRERRWGLSWLFDIHDAALRRQGSLADRVAVS